MYKTVYNIIIQSINFKRSKCSIFVFHNFLGETPLTVARSTLGFGGCSWWTMDFPGRVDGSQRVEWKSAFPDAKELLFGSGALDSAHKYRIRSCRYRLCSLFRFRSRASRSTLSCFRFFRGHVWNTNFLPFSKLFTLRAAWKISA